MAKPLTTMRWPKWIGPNWIGMTTEPLRPLADVLEVAVQLVRLGRMTPHEARWWSEEHCGR